MAEIYQCQKKFAQETKNKCQRKKEKCSCVLCVEDIDDGIATSKLKEKFRKVLSGDNSFTIYESELRGYLLESLFALRQGDYEKAVKCFRHYTLKCYHDYFFQVYPYLHYYHALIAYTIGAYAFAESEFQRYISNGVYVKNEIAYLHLGNCFFRQSKWSEALDAYGRALELRENFPEVLINIGLVARRLCDLKMAQDIAKTPTVFHGIFTKGKLCDNPLEYTLSIPTNISIWDIPIFINARDRLGTMRLLLNWLLTAGYRRIYILDNDSTYPPLLEYYRYIERHVPKVTIVRLQRNIGHTALWDSGILRNLKINTPYLYTDPDVVPIEDCPPDVLKEMMGVLQRYPFLKKVGLGLKIDDITYWGAEQQRKLEKTYYTQLLEKNLYFAQVDTTFALYRNYWHYDVFCSARMTGKYMAYHLPWYFNYDNLPEDERYYIEHASSSSTLTNAFKKR